MDALLAVGAVMLAVYWTDADADGASSEGELSGSIASRRRSKAPSSAGS